MRRRLSTCAVLAVACGGATDDGLYGAGGAAGQAGTPAEAGVVSTPDPGTAPVPPAVDGASGGNAGKKCFADGDCAPLLCSWLASECIEPLPNGGACARDEECEQGLCSWLANTCIAPQPSGAACSRDAECSSQKCAGFECQ
jgi:hypothetical protein